MDEQGLTIEKGKIQTDFLKTCCLEPHHRLICPNRHCNIFHGKRVVMEATPHLNLGGGEVEVPEHAESLQQ